MLDKMSAEIQFAPENLSALRAFIARREIRMLPRVRLHVRCRREGGVAVLALQRDSLQIGNEIDRDARPRSRTESLWGVNSQIPQLIHTVLLYENGVTGAARFLPHGQLESTASADDELITDADQIPHFIFQHTPFDRGGAEVLDQALLAEKALATQVTCVELDALLLNQMDLEISP